MKGQKQRENGWLEGKSLDGFTGLPFRETAGVTPVFEDMSWLTDAPMKYCITKKKIIIKKDNLFGTEEMQR